MSNLRPGLYGVGVGPGDPRWMTVRAIEVLQQADVLALPRGEHAEESRVQRIIRGVINPSRQRTVSLPFATSGKRDDAEASREAIFAAVTRELEGDRSVAFPLIGDPFLYGSFIYLFDRVRTRIPETHIEIVPGVTSLSAAAAHAMRPLATGHERLAVLPAVYEKDLDDLRLTLRTFDTVVLLKVNRCVNEVIVMLEELNITGGAYYAAHLGMAEEQFEPDVRLLRGRTLPYLSLLVVQHERKER